MTAEFEYDSSVYSKEGKIDYILHKLQMLICVQKVL